MHLAAPREEQRVKDVQKDALDDGLVERLTPPPHLFSDSDKCEVCCVRLNDKS